MGGMLRLGAQVGCLGGIYGWDVWAGYMGEMPRWDAQMGCPSGMLGWDVWVGCPGGMPSRISPVCTGKGTAMGRKLPLICHPPSGEDEGEMLLSASK